MTVRSVAEAWGRCVAWLEPAIEDGTEDEVLNELILGRAQLWEGDSGAVVTRCFPPDHFHIWLAGGDLGGVMALLAGGIAWARPMGLKRLTVNARKGWTRVLRDHGFTMSDGGYLERVI